MYKILLLVTICLLISGCTKSPVSKIDTTSDYSFATSNPESMTDSNAPVESLTDAVKSQLSVKYQRSISDINLTVTKEDDFFAKGSVSFAGEMGGGLWLSAKTKGGWVLVHDGQGPMTCDQADEYAFPASFVPECILDTKLIKR